MSNTRIKFLEKKEIDKIVEAIPLETSRDWRDYALLQVLFCSGLRISEALALKVQPFVESKDRETLELSIVGKGKKQRVVFFSPNCVSAVRQYLKHRRGKEKSKPDMLFPITPRAAQITIKQRAITAGFESWITPHKLRHSMATHVLRKGANMRVVQELLGHSSIATTQIYAGVTNKDLKEAHKKFMV